jgi:hypothetical protein
MEMKLVITQDQEIQKFAICWQTDVDAVLGLHWAHPQVQPGLWEDNSAWYHAILEEE